MAPVQPSEDEIGRKWDRCLVDTTFKIGNSVKKQNIQFHKRDFFFCLFLVGGAVFGGVFSLLFFRSKAHLLFNITA